MVSWPQGMWDLRDPGPGIEPLPLALEASLNHWTATEVPEGEGEVEVAQSCLTLCDPMDW